MSDIAIRAEKLGKKYHIGGPQAPYRTIRESITDVLVSPFRRLKNPKPETLWALKDISFAVERGEVVGIIGRNGAGKTTLLKILSRITEPTEGRVEIYGRVGSLLEVGTGFHPELSGRENIYLNGAILGMKRAEIDHKFDEIVAFAEIEKFLDTPIKHYSSGMYVRLAFAVAAHLEPEILLVDEVLAVGDAAFQKKCLGKMEDVARGGRTVLFVSHQMTSIRRLCHRGLWIDNGQVQMLGPTAQVVSSYEAESASFSLDDMRRAEAIRAHGRFLRWEIVEPKAEQPNMLTTLGPMTFQIIVLVGESIRDGSHGIGLRNNDNQLIWGWKEVNLKLDPGVHAFSYTLPTLPLRPGVYRWHVSLYEGAKLLDAWHCTPEMIIATKPLTHPSDEWSGILNVPCDFHVNHSVSAHNEQLGA